MQDGFSKWATSVWVVLTAPIMNIQYSLFKHATWLPDRESPDPDGQDAASVEIDNEPSLTAACFCKAAENPAKKAMASLADLFFNTNHDEWGPAVLAFGPVLTWPQARLRTARRGFCVVIGQLWRKLLFPWTQYPLEACSSGRSRSQRSREATLRW